MSCPQIDQLREEVERMEQDKSRLSQEQNQCQDKLERGKKLLGEIMRVFLLVRMKWQSWLEALFM